MRKARSAAAEPAPPPRRMSGGQALARKTMRARSAPTARDRDDDRQLVRVPVDTNNETVLIAAAIVSPKDRAGLVKLLPADGFCGKGHPAAWAGICELERRGLHYDPATMRQLAGDGVDTDYLDRLVADRPAAPPNLAFHVECFHWDRERVAVATGPLSALLDAMRDPTSDPDRVRALAAAVGKAFGGGGALPYLRDPAAVRSESMRRIRARRAGQAFYPFGLDGLDFYPDGTRRMKLGLAPKHQTLVVGLSGSGKTTLVNQIVLAQAAMRRRVLQGSWEEDGETNLELLAAFSIGLARDRLLDGEIDDAEEAALDAEMERLCEYVRFFELPFGKGPRQKRLFNDGQLDIIQRHVAESGCEIAVFDLFKAALVELDPSAEELALRRMLAIAKETNTHAVLLHHLRGKDVQDRIDSRPTRQAIKGASAWVEAVDNILAVHWPWLHSAKAPQDEIEVSVLKQRRGRWPLSIRFHYDQTTGLISGGEPFDPGQAPEGMGSFLDDEDRPNAGGDRRRGRRGGS